MKRVCVFLLFVLILLAAACGQEEPTPQPTPLPTSTPSPEPEDTSVPPTETPEPTETPLPTETPEPSPTPLSADSLIETADTQLLLSDWRGAEDAYRQAIETEPENALAHARLAYLLHFHPQTEDEAVEVAREAAELAPNDLNVVPFLILTLNRVGEYEEALTHAERIEPLAFNDPFALGIITDLYLSIGDYEKTGRLINIVLSLSGFAASIERVEVDRILTTHAFLNGDRSSVILYSIRLMDSAPQFVPAYLVRAEVMAVGGLRGTTPRGLVTEGLTLDSDYVPLMVQLARIDAQAGNFELALDSCEDIIRLFPELPHGLLCQGDVLLQQGMYEQAGESFNQVIEQYDSDYRGYIGRGRTNLGLEDCETAANDLLTALEDQPYAFQAHVSLGETYACQGNVAEAETAFQGALALRPFDAATHFGLGSLYLDQNRFEEAGESFLTAISSSPSGSVPPAYFSQFGRTLQAVNGCNLSGSTPESTYYLCAGTFLLAAEGFLVAADAFSLALGVDENSLPALEGLVIAYSGARLCDVALPYLIQLSENSEPRPEIVEYYDANCTVADPTENFIPEGELVSEDEAIRMIETAVAQVEGIGDIFVFFDTFDFELTIGEQRILILQFITDLDRDSAELNRQLSEAVFAAAEGFALADTEPFLMFIQARTSLTEIPAGFIVARIPTILWYNGDVSTAEYRQTWATFDDVLENIEQEGEQSAYNCCASPQERYFYSFREKAVTMPKAT